MSQYLPPKTPQQKQEDRVNIISALLWMLAIPPVMFAIMAFGYSDQAPAFLRTLTLQLDGLLGQPVWSLIGPGK